MARGQSESDRRDAIDHRAHPLRKSVAGCSRSAPIPMQIRSATDPLAFATAALAARSRGARALAQDLLGAAQMATEESDRALRPPRANQRPPPHALQLSSPRHLPLSLRFWAVASSRHPERSSRAPLPFPRFVRARERSRRTSLRCNRRHVVQSERGSSTPCPGAPRKTKITGHSAQNDGALHRIAVPSPMMLP